jgi:O-methyltransferase involved in polyketide biosynthesis
MTSSGAARAADGGRSRGIQGFDARVAHPARVYDYWLGGKDNFEADRIAGEATIAAYPAIRASARANRAFLARTVRYLAAEQGIRQFLDIGTGLPTASNTHEVAQSVAAESRIVYVDNDPLVLVHARALLTSSPEGATAYIDTDLREVDYLLEQAADTLDFSQPVAVMLLAILHYIPDLEEAQRIVARLMSAMPPGSFMAISHAASDIDPDEMAEMIRRMNEHLAEGNHVGRPREVVAQFFGGLELVEPGVVKVTEWRARSEVEAAGPTSLWGGVARKPLAAHGGGDQAVGSFPRGRLLADRVGHELVGVQSRAFGVAGTARVQPALELRAVDLGVELQGQVPTQPERLHAGRVAGQDRRLRRREAAVAVELQPGAGRDRLVIERVDHDPADLLAAHGLDPAAEGGADRLATKTDPQDRHAGLVRLAQPAQLLGDPGVGVVDGADGAEHHDVIDAGQGGQRAVVGKQVDGQLGAPGLERVRDEARRIHVVMPDDEYSHQAGP